jgi:hypothetical protein
MPYNSLTLSTLSLDPPITPTDSAGDRLSRIEAILEQQAQQLGDILQLVGPASHASGVTLPPLYLPPELAATPSPAIAANRLLAQPQAAVLDSHQFLIPPGHTTSPNSLLSSPPAKYLVGDYPTDYFFDIEERRPLPEQLDFLKDSDHEWPPLNPNILDSLADGYFQAVHSHNPIFTREAFTQWKSEVYKNGPSDNMATAICCCVWALGALMAKGRAFANPEQQTERDELALNLFRPALRVILCQSIWAFTPKIEYCQGLLLAGAFFSHSGRPLHNSRMVYFAARHFVEFLEV